MTKIVTTRVITIRYEALLEDYINHDSKLETLADIVAFEKSYLVDLAAFLDDIVDEQVTVEFVEE